MMLGGADLIIRIYGRPGACGVGTIIYQINFDYFPGEFE
jgi:hypothetical protein